MLTRRARRTRRGTPQKLQEWLCLHPGGMPAISPGCRTRGQGGKSRSTPEGLRPAHRVRSRTDISPKRAPRTQRSTRVPRRASRLRVSHLGRIPLPLSPSLPPCTRCAPCEHSRGSGGMLNGGNSHTEDTENTESRPRKLQEWLRLHPGGMPAISPRCRTRGSGRKKSVNPGRGCSRKTGRIWEGD
jgi:hypothetical protein